MEKVTMTIHQALSTLKMLDKRIRTASRQTFVSSKKKSAETIEGMDLKSFNALLTGNLQKVKQLIENRKALRSAVVLSNAATKITVSGTEYTVAEAIERKANMNSEEHLLSYLQNQYRQVNQRIEQENSQLEHRLESYLMSVLGKDARKAEDVKKHTEEFYARNELELVDPNNLVTSMTELEKSILDFMNEVDYKLSESNSTTTIEVAYLNV